MLRMNITIHHKNQEHDLQIAKRILMGFVISEDPKEYLVSTAEHIY